MPITRFKDEKEKEEYLKQIRQQQEANLQEANRRNQEATAKFNEISNNNNSNTTSTNSNSLWEQIKTTASNFLGNTGYGIANGLIGFAQNERRNQTTTKTLKALGDTVLNQTLLGLPNALGRIGKSIDSTFKNNEKYQNAKNIIESTIEKNKNVVLNPIDEKLQKQEDVNNEKIQQNIDETTNSVGKKLVELAPSLGQMLPSAIPYAGMLYSVGSATDSYYDEAKARGMNEEQASNYSQLMGGVEGLTEQIGIGKLVKGGKGIAKGTVKQAFKDLGIGVTDNFIQEAVTEPASELVTKATAGDKYLKNDYRTSEGWKNLGKDMLKSGFDGAITAGIMGGVSAGLGKSINVYNKLKNGQQPTVNEYKEAFTEQKENGIDVDGNVQNEFKKRIAQSRQVTSQNTNQITNTQQDISNRLNEIVKNDKYLSQEDKDSMIYATNNLASKNQLDSTNTLDAINQIKRLSQISQEKNDQLDIGKKYLSGRKEIYNQYRNVTDYDNSIVQQAKDTIAPNKQGKRTKEQWLNVAKYIGTNIADRPNSEIQKIAYKSWQEETPNNSATLNKQGQKYVKFMSDDWIDTIYDAVEKQRQKSGYVANNDTVNALDNLYNEYTNNQTVQNNNIKNNIDTASNNLKVNNLNNEQTTQDLNLSDKNIENTNNNLYNTNIDRGDINEQTKSQFEGDITRGQKSKSNESRMVRNDEEIGNSERGRSTSIITDSKGKNDGSRISKDNISKEEQTIEEKFDDRKSIEKTIEYAKKNPYVAPSKEVQEVQNKSKELGIPVNIYSGEDGNEHIGLTDGKEIYLDINKNNISNEDGSLMDRFSHEIFHYVKRNTSFADSINELQSKLVSNHSDSITKFVQQKGYDSNNLSNRAMNYLAEEVLADYSAKYLAGYKVDYNLPEEITYTLNTTLNDAITELKIKNNNKSNDVEKITSTKQGNNKMNPIEISKLKPEDASTTPNLKSKKYAKGNKQSSFFSNIVTDSEFLNKELRQEIGNEESVKYYKGITNKETLKKSYKELQDGGSKEVLNWFSKNDDNITADDITKGWILLKQYQDAGDYASAVEVAKKMRNMGTKAGQTVQAFNILSRLTPEGMTLYAQKELSEAYDQMVKGKSKKWIEENESKFDLSPNETAFIKDTMEQVSKMEDGYDKKVKLAEIQKLITDKIPPAKGQGIKAWMRISMLFNPKTQVRNVAGNAVILPVNMFSDSVSAGVDRLISKKTGVRTTGNINIKNYAKGFGKGLSESYNDFKKGINTRNIEENRFEVGEGKSFKDKGIGKALNRVDGLLSFMLDAGDRGFYEATFNNSINNQKVLNGTNNVTQDMIDIATTEALQRTWQDSNTYTSFVLGLRNWLNKVNAKGYGLGDVLIPFAKTPANLTKAIIDYSPIGLTKTLTLDAKKFKNAIDTEQYVPQMQHKFVQDIGKGFAGTFLYVAGYSLAKAGILSGEADDDKDVKNFMKNSLGISSYSIKIGNKSFTYDWAQPVATPFAIMSNFVKYDKENPDASILEKGIKALNIGTEQLLEQSFMESLNTVLNGNGEILENLAQSVFELPARAIPTFSKQIADMVDSTQRTTFEYDKPIQSAVNSVIAKIPIASKSLATSKDTLGNEIQKYGGENNFFNVFINPANTNKGKITKAGTEIYDLYMKTGDSKVFPVTAPYYINNNGDKIVMNSKQRAEYQKTTGDYTEKAIDELINNKDYKKLSDDKKVELISNIINDSNNMAKYKVLNIESKDAKKTRELIEKVGTKAYYDYSFKTQDIEGENANKQKMNILEKANYSNNIKSELYSNTIGQNDDNYNTIYKNAEININEYLKYKQQDFESDKKDDGTLQGKSTKNKKNKVFDYVNNMKLSYENRLLLLGTQYKLSLSERNTLFKHVNSLNANYEDKLKFLGKCKGFTVYKNGTVEY